MAETTKVALRPLPKIAIGVALFVLAGIVFGATNIGGLLALCIGLVAFAFVAIGVGNLLDRRKRVKEIDESLRAIAKQIPNASSTPQYRELIATRARLRAERATLATWPLK